MTFRADALYWTSCLGERARRPEIATALGELGRPGSRLRLPTPAAVVDLDALDRNIQRLADRARRAGVALRPHAKSHKCAFIGRRQLEAGAVGVSCAKLGEAEALVQAGLGGVLVTSPVNTADVARRAAALAVRDPGLLLVADHEQGVRRLSEAARDAGVDLDVLIDIDVGSARTGVASPSDAVRLAAEILCCPRLRLKGVQGYAGHVQQIPGATKKARAIGAVAKRFSAALTALEAAGHPVPIRTGGGTGSFDHDLQAGVLNELQPGSYVFLDRQYRESLGHGEDRLENSLFVQATVVSINAPGWITVDAGLKAFATDGPLPLARGARFQDVAYAFFGDEHGRLTPRGDDPQLGERVEFEVPHCDPTVDRFDVLYLVRSDTLIGIVPVEARGRSQ